MSETRRSWWRNQTEIFFALLDFCAGNSPLTGEFPSRKTVTRSFDVFFDLRLNKRLSKQSRRRWFETPLRFLWRHCNILTVDTGPLLPHYDMFTRLLSPLCEESSREMDLPLKGSILRSFYTGIVVRLNSVLTNLNTINMSVKLNTLSLTWDHFWWLRIPPLTSRQDLFADWATKQYRISIRDMNIFSKPQC